jgi:hypothetical protein
MNTAAVVHRNQLMLREYEYAPFAPDEDVAANVTTPLRNQTGNISDRAVILSYNVSSGI